MGEIVNLRRVKRQRARQDAAELAAENRARHGRTAGQVAVDRLAAEREAWRLDGAKLAGPAKDEV